MMADYGDYGYGVYLWSFKHAFFKFFYVGGVSKEIKPAFSFVCLFYAVFSGIPIYTEFN